MLLQSKNKISKQLCTDTISVNLNDAKKTAAHFFSFTNILCFSVTGGIWVWGLQQPVFLSCFRFKSYCIAATTWRPFPPGVRSFSCNVSCFIALWSSTSQNSGNANLFMQSENTQRILTVYFKLLIIVHNCSSSSIYMYSFHKNTTCIFLK